MERTPLFDAAAILSERGIIVRISRELGILQPTVSHIFHGKRRATLAQAVKLEAFFINQGVPLTRWDLLFYIPRGMTLKEYVASRITCNREAEHGK